MASTAVRQQDVGYSRLNPRQRFCDLIRQTGLSEAQIAEEFEIADRLLEQWCIGRARIPKWAYLALEGILSRRWRVE
jgi:hypothetical protein